MTQLSEEQQEPTKAIALGKYHVLRFDKGHYSYECDRGLLAGGPWDNRPKQCNGIGCRRELVEQSTLDAAIESAAIAMRDKCVETIRGLRPEATGAGAFKDAAIRALSNLTLDQVKLEEQK